MNTTRKGYINLALHILLLVFTAGIWNLVWIYRTTKYLNSESVVQRSPVCQLLLCMFVPFYYLFWTVKTAELIDEAEGKNTGFPILCLVFVIFIGIVPPILIQHKINKLSKMEVKVISVGGIRKKVLSFECPKCGKTTHKVPCENCGYYPELDGTFKGAAEVTDATYHVGMAKHILLIIFTLGIWELVWIFRTTKFLSAEIENSKRNAVVELLLCMIIPFYKIYWLCKTTDLAAEYSLKRNKLFDGKIVSCVFAFFAPIISDAIIQGNLDIAIVGNGQICDD